MYKIYARKTGIHLPWIFQKILLIMRLTIVILIAAFMQVSASTYAQRITMEQRNVKLETVLKEIRKQTGYDFLYKASIIDNAGNVNVKFSNVPFEEAMKTLFEKLPLTYSVDGKVVTVEEKTPSFLDLPKSAFANIDVRGKILDETGKPLEGATVVVKGTNRTTKTDAKGEFVIANVPDDGVLVIRYVGYKELEVSLKDGVIPLEIKLNVATGELEEVNVTYSTGYQNIPKERATGSFELLDNKQFNQLAGTDVLSRLQYIANGVTVMPQRFKSNNIGIMVRGISTFGGPKDPLIVIDNFPYNGNLNNINPNDVENITILKDAAAASIWGAKAGNGVIVITTKKGKFNQPIQLGFNANLTVAEKPDLFSIKRMSSAETIEAEQYLFDNGFYDFRFPYPNYYSLTPAVTIMQREKEDEISKAEAKLQLDKLRATDVRNEFNKLLYQNAVNQQYALDVSGGTNNHSWMLSGGFDRNASELDETFKRYTARFSNTYNALKNLDVFTNVSYTQTNNGSGKTGFNSYSASQLPLYTHLIGDHGQEMPLYTYSSLLRQGYIDTLGGGRLLDWKYYPLQDYKHSTRKTGIQDISAEIGLSYKFLDAFSLNLTYRYQNQKNDEDFYQGINSYYTRSLVNTFSQINYKTGVVSYKVPKNGIVDLTNGDLRGHDLRAQLNFDKKWEKHQVTAILGGQTSDVLRKSAKQRIYGYDENLYTNVSVDYINPYPNFIYGNDEYIPGGTSISKGTTRLVSVYGNAAYTFNGRYTFSASARRDATNNFGADIKDKWKPLWSSGLSWGLSDESFYKLKLLPYLKFRLTYGYSGNVDPSRVAETTIRYQGSLNTILNLPFARLENFYNPELRWEQVSQLNVAADFKMRNNRISGSIEFFEKRMTDLYGPAPIDVTTGLGRQTVPKNVGKMKGKGVDLELNSVILDGDFRWSNSFILNYYKDEIIDLADKSALKAEVITGGNALGIKGYPVHSYFAYKSGGLDPLTGDPRGYMNGELSKNYTDIINNTKVEDLEFVGGMFPKYKVLFGNGFTYKGFTLNIGVIAKFGYYFRRQSIDYDGLYYQLQGHADYGKRWQKPGDEKLTTVPSRIYPVTDRRDLFYTLSDDLATKGDHIRLQYINLDYDLNKMNFKNLPVKHIQLYTKMNNVGLLWTANKFGIDPESELMAGQRSIVLGVRVSF